MELIQMCADEIKTRFLVDLDCFKVKLIDSQGIHTAKDIRAKRLLDNQSHDQAMQV